MAPSLQDEWKQMVDQDPHSGSVTGDSGHGTMTATGEDEPINNIKELVGAVGRVDKSVAAEVLLDVELRDDDPLFVFDDDNVMKPRPQLPLRPLFEHVRKKIKLFPQLNRLSGKSLAFENLLPNSYRRQLQFASNLTIATQNYLALLNHDW